MDLLFGGVEGEVADVEGGCILELVFGLGSLFLGSVIVGSTLVSTALLESNQRQSRVVGRGEGTLATVYELGRSRRSHVVRNMMLAAMVGIDKAGIGSWERNV